nr:hypothetical protein [Tanacetum cinerariifolium]
MSSRGNGVLSALALSNDITNLAGAQIHFFDGDISEPERSPVGPQRSRTPPPKAINGRKSRLSTKNQTISTCSFGNTALQRQTKKDASAIKKLKEFLESCKVNAQKESRADGVAYLV